MTRKYVDDRGRLTSLTIRGGDGSFIDLHERFQTGTLSFSTSQISQLSVTIRESADYVVLYSGLFEPADGTGRSVNDGALDLADLQFTISSTTVKPSGRGVNLSATALSWGGVRMASNTDPSTLTKIDPAEWVRRKATSLGLKAVVKPSGQVWQQVGNESGKDSWATAQQLAKDLGYWCFEAAGTLYFGPPTWLVNQTQRRTYTWAHKPINEQNTDDVVLEMPEARRASGVAEGTSATTMTWKLRDTENDILPGMGFQAAGVPKFFGLYIVTDVSFPLGPGGIVQVSVETPVDPIPGNTSAKYVRSEALENAGAAVGSGQSTRVPAPGRFAGTSLSAEQLGHARTITQVAIDKKLTMPKAAVLGLMCALQESTLRNLTGGDRDSVGLFQQRPSQGWGTPAQCRTPTYAAGKFYDTLVRMVPAYATTGTTTAMGDAVQKVQRSGHPRAYDKWRDEAEALVAAIVVTGTTTSSAAAVTAGTGQVEQFVQKCLAQAGDTYRFGAEVKLADPNPSVFDCSELVEWACYQVGVKIADGSQNQRRACKAFRQLSIAQARQTRGALLFTSGHVAVSLGDGRTIEAKGRRYGVVIDSVGTRFADAGLIPGMSGYVVKG